MNGTFGTRLLWAVFCCGCLSQGFAAQTKHRSFVGGYPASAASATWKLAYTENFNGKRLDAKVWRRIEAGRPDWCRNMSTRDDLATVSGGQLHLHGVKNGDLASDARRVLTGGVSTQGRLAMQYGKVEIKCRLEGQKGAWPAIWMMPEKAVRGWPNDGEIDIVERLNDDAFVYQTLHYGNGSPQDLTHGGRGTIRKDDWNVYGLEWTPDEIAWTVNGKRTFLVRRAEGDDELKWPWRTPFYLMIDMQLGGSWVGAVDESTLPVAMHVDWVKFYHGHAGGKKFSRFVRTGRKAGE